MSNRIGKTRRTSTSDRKAAERDSLLAAVLSSRPTTMALKCSYCARRGLDCLSSGPDSRRCSSCIRDNQSHCDVRGLTPEQLGKVAAQHKKFEDELDAAEEEVEIMQTRVRRLRKQKKMWYEKMMKAVARGIVDLEEFEMLEKQEREKDERREREDPSTSSGGQRPETIPEIDWAALDAAWEVDPSLLALGDQGVGGETDPQQLRQSPNVS